MEMSDKRALDLTLDRGKLKELIHETTHSKLPPIGFEPLIASQQDLAELCFPRRPDPSRQPAEYAFWQLMFTPPFFFDTFDFDLPPNFPISFDLVGTRQFGGQLP